MRKDIIGKKFGRLFVEEFSYIKNGRPHWKCKCDCGKYKICNEKTLLSGGTSSCGCLQKQRIREACLHDLSGKRFSFLTAEEFVYKNKTSYWKCKCDCGNYTIVNAYKLKTGHTRSCGCLLRRVSRNRAIERNKKMSGKNHPFWRHDLSQKDREENKIRNYNPKLYRWRKKVYDRDKYTCQKCGDSSGGNLIAHHIYSWNSHKNLRFITRNGITLCEFCHNNFHKKFGNGNNTQKQFSIWMKSQIPE